MKKFLILGIVAALCSCADNHGGRPCVETVNGVKIVSLYGSWFEMGRQYGEFLSSELDHVVNCFMKGIMEDDGQANVMGIMESDVIENENGILDSRSEKERNIRSIADSLYMNYPHSLKSFFEGMSESSDLSVDELKIANAVEYAEGAFFCSGIGAWGPYTADGELLYARSYDAVSYSALKDDIVLAFLHPDDGSIPIAIMGYAGEIYGVNVFNAKGLMAELNNGMPSGGYEIRYDMISGTVQLMNMMLQADDMEYVDAFLRSTDNAMASIIGVADAGEARVYEWCFGRVKRADGFTPEGLTVMNNHYVNDEWGVPEPDEDTCWHSHARRANILETCTGQKGSLTANALEQLLATPVSEGGCMLDAARYQFVYKPATGQLRFRIVEYGSWGEINLNRYF